MNYSKMFSLRSKVLSVLRAMWMPSLAFAIMWVALLAITYKYITVSPWIFVMLLFVPMELFDIFLLLRNRRTKTVYINDHCVEDEQNCGCDDDRYDEGYDDNCPVDEDKDEDEDDEPITQENVKECIGVVLGMIQDLIGKPESKKESKSDEIKRKVSEAHTANAPKRSHHKKPETKKESKPYNGPTVGGQPVNVEKPKRSHHKKK